MSTTAAAPILPPKDWKTLAPAPPKGTITFEGQSTLERLPVPQLESTLTKLKRSLKAIAWSEDEYKITERKINQFASGFGPELQRRLERRRDEPGREHWLEEWWDAGSYNGYRDPVMIYVSYYYGFDDHPPKYPQNPVHRAAALTRAALLFRKQFRQGAVKPDAVREGVLCMDTWRWMFDCCRVPAPGLDWSITYAKEGDTGIDGHIVVFRRGRPWKIDIAPKGSILSTEELERQFEHIYRNTDKDYPGVGALTSADRDTWAKDYADLAQDPQNAAIIREIHSAAFVISLDTEKPETPVDFSRALWHAGVKGDMLGNRWFDKPINLVVFDNNKAGVVGEHSVMDGTPMVRFCDEVLDGLLSDNFDHGTASISSIPEPPQPLDWNVTSKIEQAILTAQASGKDLISAHLLGYHLTQYGKSAIKTYGVSPDSCAQMIIQLAYYRLLGPKRPGGTYEAATTRRFLKGRTETIRTVTIESEAWVRAMDDLNVGTEAKKQLLKQACEVHIRDARDAGKAQGIDRHLLGLRKLVQENETMPEIYSDPVYMRGSRWTLSTSAIWSRHFPVYGWGEVVPDGFGVAYMTGYDDRLQFTVTSRKEMPNTKFVQEIAKAAEDIRALFEGPSAESGKSRL